MWLFEGALFTRITSGTFSGGPLVASLVRANHDQLSSYLGFEASKSEMKCNLASQTEQIGFRRGRVRVTFFVRRACKGAAKRELICPITGACWLKLGPVNMHAAMGCTP